MRLLLAPLAAVAACALLINPAAAQVRTQSGAAGGTGSTLFSSGGCGSLFGGGATGGVGGGGVAGGAAQQFGAAATNPFTLNEQGGRGGFVGRDSNDTAAVFEALGAANNSFLERVERNFAARNRGRDSNQLVDARSKIRVTLKLAFTPARPASSLPTATAARLNGLFAERGFAGAVAQSTAAGLVLKGSVPEDADRRMLARLAMLEPGVPSVKNELIIAP